MARLLWILAGVFVCGAAVQAAIRTADAGSDNLTPQPETIASLRARGTVGLEEALHIYDGLVAEQQKLRLSCIAHPDDNSLAVIGHNIEAWSAAISQIGGQRSCTVSRLFWYTDLAEAKAAAERENKPILSLRMLGRLTDEYSCANSRFFRTTLYSNKDISDFLRNNYILHWQSVRPVPRVTIDFGDGRKLERTLTGNSAHYVLASDGTPLDVLPGLYSPLAFRQWLLNLRQYQIAYAEFSADERPARLREFHSQLRDETLRRWDADIQRLGDQRSELVSTRITSALTSARLAGKQVPADQAPKAVKAAVLAVGKTAAEQPMLRFANLGGAWMERGMDDDLWQAVSDLHRDDVKLDEASVEVVRREFPAAVAMRASASKARQEDPVLRMVQTFENSISLDTVRNEYLLHRRIHEQFADGAAVTTHVDPLNEWVYAELFLTPSSDPWLGLAPPDVYTALEQDGRIEPSTEAAGGG